MSNIKENILGVDIGGSKIKMVLWDGEKVLKEWKSETATLEKLKQGLANFDCKKVGIGLPGLLDFKNGKTLFCQNLPNFNNVNLKTCFPMEIKTDNDAKCFLRAEMAVAKERNLGYVLGVIFGTGIGGAINGYRGNNGWAGEFGHMIVGKTLRQAQGKTWEKLYQETKNKPVEQEIINAMGLANLINIFNPEAIILGGKGAKKPNKELIEKYLLLPKKQMPKFITAKLKDNSVAIGAAMLYS
jgi:glucokinase